MNLIPLGIYRHYKGNKYEVIGADLDLFPEMWNIGYALKFDRAENLSELNIPLQGVRTFTGQMGQPFICI